jgi:hypothetical protein
VLRNDLIGWLDDHRRCLRADAAYCLVSNAAEMYPRPRQGPIEQLDAESLCRLDLCTKYDSQVGPASLLHCGQLNVDYEQDEELLARLGQIRS